MLVSFGDIVNFKENTYIFLAETTEVTYLARVLDKNQTASLLKLCENRANQNKDLLGHTIFSFVVLTTNAFKDQAASFHNPGTDSYNSYFEKPNCNLDSKDLTSIKEHILDSHTVPLELKTLVSSANV